MGRVKSVASCQLPVASEVLMMTISVIGESGYDKRLFGNQVTEKNIWRLATGDWRLYDPQFEHDACGVGFVADIAGRASPAILETALEALGNLSHRGARDADGKTGDGAGVLTRIPRKLFLKEVEKFGYARPGPEDLAVALARCYGIGARTCLASGE